jgi:ABC-2 type transport system permease protein
MKLLRIELHKILYYRTAWVILGIFVGLLVLILYSSSHVTVNGSELGNEMYKLPGFWQTLTYTASFFNMLFGILIIVLVTDEYTFRTFRQQVIDGLSRAELVLAKFYMILGLASFGTLLLFGLGLYFGLVYTSNPKAADIFAKIDFLAYYFVQAVGYMVLAMFFGFLIRKSGMAIVAFIAYSQIVEPLIHFRLPDEVDKFMPVKSFKSLTPMPGQNLLDQLTTPTELLSQQAASPIAIAYIGLFLLLCYFLLKMRDL